MNGEQILKERSFRKWEQLETATKLKVSQPYLSLIERGKRPVTDMLARRVVRLFQLPPTALPVKEISEPTSAKSKDLLATQLAGLGYPKFSHLSKSKKVNPAIILISALQIDDIDSRIVEALPWLIYKFSEMDWTKIIKSAKVSDAQNRLGYLLSFALEKSIEDEYREKEKLFSDLILSLEKSILVREDSFNRQNLTNAERIWLQKNRSNNAKYWRVLSNLTFEYLTF